MNAPPLRLWELAYTLRTTTYDRRPPYTLFLLCQLASQFDKIDVRQQHKQQTLTHTDRERKIADGKLNKIEPLTSYWLSIGPGPPSPDCRWWWWCGRYCRPRAPRSWRSGSWRRIFGESRRSWCHPCRWCSQSGRLRRSSRAAAAGLGSRDSLYAVATQPVQPRLLGQSLD